MSIAAAAEAKRPAVLFCSPQGVAYGWLNLDYAIELHGRGFEVDYTDSLADVTAQRIGRYNVLVVYTAPDSFDVTMRGRPSSASRSPTKPNTATC